MTGNTSSNQHNTQSATNPATPPQKPYRYWQEVWTRFQRNRLAWIAWRFILVLALIAILADFIANEKPLICQIDGKIYFPIISSYLENLGIPFPERLRAITDWHNASYDWAIWPLVPYLPQNMDFNNLRVGPFDKQDVPSIWFRHWLGTDDLGRDVLAGLIHATRISLSVGIVAMAIAAFIGILLGSLAGYFGDHTLRMRWGVTLFTILALIPAWFYGCEVRSYALQQALNRSIFHFLGEALLSLLIIAVIFLIAWALGRLLGWLIPVFRKRHYVPLDILISRFIEIVVTIPTIFLIIGIIAIARPSLFLVMAVIGLTGWTGIARFVRAELLRIRALQYTEAARALGYSHVRILLRHVLPNGLTPVLIAIAFGVASAILIEATLSFLGLGVPPDVVTWGSMLSLSRRYPEDWWLAVFPGMAIFLTVTALNLIGEGLIDAIDPRQRQLNR